MSYRYARFGNVYVSMQRSLLTLPWYLLTCRPLAHEFRGGSRRGPLERVTPRLPAQRVMRFVLSLASERAGRRVPRRTVELPLDGHVAVPLNLGGYKVIDLARRTVVTLYAAEGDADAISSSIRKTVRAGRLPFAPRVVSFDLARRTVEEEFINGTPTSTVDAWETIVVPLAARIAAAEPPRRIALGDYRAQLLEGIARDVSLLADGDRRRVTRFVDGVDRRLEAARDTELGLVLSHGDVWGDNILAYRGSLYAIDWAAADLRSALYDLHYALFIPLEWGDAPAAAGALDRLGRQLSLATTAMQERLREQLSALHLSVLFPDGMSPDVHRWLFYLEFISSCLQECGEGATDAVREHRTTRIRTFVGHFEAYERLATR